MPLKIRPNAIEQDQGDFIFPGVISLRGATEFSFDADGITGSSQITARDTTSGFKTPISIHGSVVQLIGNDGSVAVQVEEGGGVGVIRLNPTAQDFDLVMLADDGSPLIYADGGSGTFGIGTSSPASKLHVATLSGLTEIRSEHNDPTVGGSFRIYNGISGTAELNAWGNEFPTAARRDNIELINLTATGNVEFWTDRTRRMTIDENGAVGIGTQSPYGDFEVFRAGAGRTRGDFHVDSVSGTVTVGRLSSTGGDSTKWFNVRNRVGTDFFSVEMDTGKVRLGNDQIVVTPTGTTINPQEADHDLTVLADDGRVLLHTDAGNGNVGIGTSTPEYQLHVVWESSGYPTIALGGHNDTGWVPHFDGYKSRGTYDAPTAVANGNRIVEFNAWAYDGDAYRQVGRLYWYAGETFNTGTRGTNMILETMRPNSLSRANLMFMDWSPDPELVFNESGLDIDFRFETDNNVNGMYLRGTDGFFGLGTIPARAFHIDSATGIYARLDVAGVGMADQIEYLRGSSFTWLGPTEGDEFHLWSQEDFPFVLGLDNTEVMRWHGDGYGQLSGVTANPTGTTAVSSNDLRWWVTDVLSGDDALLLMNDGNNRMVGMPHGYYAVANTVATTITATPTYAKLTWSWLFGGILNRTAVGMLTHNSATSDTDFIIRDSGIFEIVVNATTVVTAGTNPTTCHGYIDKNGTKLTGTDFYTYNINVTNGWDTGSTLWLGSLTAGDVISVKMTKAVGTNTVTSLAGGSRFMIRQVGFD